MEKIKTFDLFEEGNTLPRKKKVKTESVILEITFSTGQTKAVDDILKRMKEDGNVIGFTKQLSIDNEFNDYKIRFKTPYYIYAFGRDMSANTTTK